MENCFIWFFIGFCLLYEVFIPATVVHPDSYTHILRPCIQKKIPYGGCLMGIAFRDIITMPATDCNTHAYIRNHFIESYYNWIFPWPDISVCTSNPGNTYKPRFCQYAGE